MVAPLAQDKGDGARLTGSDLDSNLQGAARVEAEFSAAAVVAQWRELFADFGAE